MVIRPNSKGFTLIELMIAIAIIGVLVAIAYPSYTQYRVRSNRAAAQTEMMYIAHRMQAYKTVNNSYGGATVTTVYGGSVTPSNGTALYNLTFSPSPTVATDWMLIAKPITGSLQGGNGWICLNDQGQKLWVKGVSNCTALSTTSDWTGK